METSVYQLLSEILEAINEGDSDALEVLASRIEDMLTYLEEYEDVDPDDIIWDD